MIQKEHRSSEDAGVSCAMAEVDDVNLAVRCDERSIADRRWEVDPAWRTITRQLSNRTDQRIATRAPSRS